MQLQYQEKLHATSILEKLQEQLNNEDYCDVTLDIGDAVYVAHKCILAAASPFFASLFKKNMLVRETITVKFGKYTPDALTVHSLLMYIYSGSVNLSSRVSIENLLNLSDKLQMNTLKNICTECFVSDISATNCISFREIARRYSLPSLHSACNNLLQKELSEVLNGEEVLSLNRGHLEEFLKEQIEKNSCRLPEIANALLLCIIRWLMVQLINSNDSCEVTSIMLSLVPWRNVSQKIAEDMLDLLTDSLQEQWQHRMLLYHLVQFYNANDLLSPNMKHLLSYPSDSKHEALPVNNSTVTELAISAAIKEVCNSKPSNIPEYSKGNQTSKSGSQYNSLKSNVNFKSNIDSNCNDKNVDAIKIGSTKRIEVSSVNNSSDLNHNVEKDFKALSVKYKYKKRKAEESIQHVASNTSYSTRKVQSHTNRGHEKQDCPSISGYRMKDDEYDKSYCDSQTTWTVPSAVVIADPGDASLETRTSTKPKDVDRRISFDKRLSFENFFEFGDRPIDKHQNSTSMFNTDDLLTTPEKLICNAPSILYDTSKSYIEEDSSQLNPEVNFHGNIFSTSVSKRSSCDGSINTSVELSDKSMDISDSAVPQSHTQIRVSSPHQAEDINLPDQSNNGVFSIDDSNNVLLPQIVPSLPLNDMSYKLSSETNTLASEITSLGEVSHKTVPTLQHRSDVNEYTYVEDKDSTVTPSHPADSLQNLKLKLFRVDKNGSNSYQSCKIKLKQRNYEAQLSKDMNLNSTAKSSMDNQIIFEHSLQTKSDSNTLPEEPSELFIDACLDDSNCFALKDSEKDVTLDKQAAHSDTDSNASVKHGFGSNVSANAETTDAYIVEMKDTVMELPSGATGLNNYYTNQEHSFEGYSSAPFYSEIGADNLEDPKAILKSTDDARKKRRIKKTLSPNAAPAATSKKSCDVCDKMFPVKEYYAHVKSVHFPGPLHQCDSCSRAFRSIYHLMEHRLTHTSIRPHNCPDCNATFKKLYNLKFHQQSHHEEKRSFKCIECAKRFSRKQQLDEHMSGFHSDVKRHTCTTCGWKTKTRNSLLLHQRTHSGKVFTCQAENCAYSTARKSHFTEHLMTHSSAKDYKCTTCGSNYSSRSNLMRHIKTHSVMESSHSCAQCDYTTNRKDILKRHIMTVHKINEEASFNRNRQLKKKDGALGTHVEEQPQYGHSEA